MSKLDILWAYQEADMEVIRCETEMRKDPTRNKLLRLRNFVQDQQKELQTLDTDAEAARVQIETLTEQSLRNEQWIKEGAEKLESGDFDTLEAVQLALQDAKKVLENAKTAERELKRIKRDAEGVETKLKDISQKVAQAKTQYNQLKEGYDQTFAEQTAKLEALKASREQSAQGMDPVQKKRYEDIKQQCTPPIAKLLGDQCGGCNMSLPAVVTKRVKDDTGMVECENCGRILYLP